MRAVLAVSLAAGACGAVLGGAAARPNLLLVMVDDSSFSDFEPLGGEARMPAFSALAARGTLLTNYYTSPLCSPSRSMLLTGLDSHVTGLASIAEVMPSQLKGQPGYSLSLEPGVTTVATRLRAAGYRTYMSGKWHLGHANGNRTELPVGHGFDKSFALDASGADNYEQKPYMPYYRNAPWFKDGEAATLPEHFYSSEFLVDEMVRYLEQGRVEAPGRPFFAYLAFQAMHIPVQAPREFSDHYAGRFNAGWEALQKERWLRAKQLGLIARDAPQPGFFPGYKPWSSQSEAKRKIMARSMEVYTGMLEAMDRHFGRLVAYLEQSGQHDNTVIVITTDNGSESTNIVDISLMKLWMSTFGGYSYALENLGEKGSLGFIGKEWAWAISSPGAGCKFLSNQGGIHVPLIAAGPGIKQGARSAALAHVADVTPTLLHLAGLDPRAASGERPMYGRSLRGVLDGSGAGQRGEADYVSIEVAGFKALMRGATHHKIVQMPSPEGDGSWHLYDTLSDPGETKDMAKSRPDLLAAMVSEYEAYAKANGVLPLPDGYNVHQQALSNATAKMVKNFKYEIAALVFASVLLLLLTLVRALCGRRRAARDATKKKKEA